MVWGDYGTCACALCTQHWKAHGPFPWQLCHLGDVAKTQFTDGREIGPLLLFFFKCQVAIAWLGFESLFTQASQRPLKWRCLPGRLANGPVLIDCLPHGKDRCVLMCQVKTNKSIASYQAGWQTPLPFVIGTIPFPGPPRKRAYIKNQQGILRRSWSWDYPGCKHMTAKVCMGL